jgi:purine-nucleoside phosphorylase
LIDLEFKYKDLIKTLKDTAPFKPKLAIVLGSGLGSFVENVNIIKSISTGELPDYPRSTIEGHRGNIHFCEKDGKHLLLFEGRIHFYEGYKIYECVLNSLISKELGCEKMIITNAAGGINPNLNPGDLMLADSFNGIFIKTEMSKILGMASIETKNKFMNFPSQEFNDLISKTALKKGIKLQKGTYWYTKGPSYETPAEIKMIKKFGGDAVGMSTVHEAFYAAFWRLEVSSISCITNYAAGISSKKLEHAEVIETAILVKDKFHSLIEGIIADNI